MLYALPITIKGSDKCPCSASDWEVSQLMTLSVLNWGPGQTTMDGWSPNVQVFLPLQRCHWCFSSLSPSILRTHDHTTSFLSIIIFKSQKLLHTTSEVFIVHSLKPETSSIAWTKDRSYVGIHICLQCFQNHV